MTHRYPTLIVLFLGLAIGAILQAQASPPLVDIPTPAANPNKNIEVYFSGESRPTRKYLQYRYLSASKRGYDDPNALVVQLRAQAAAIGADGLILFELQKRVEGGYVADTYVETPMMDMNALAFVYPENISFVPGQIKVRTFFKADKTDAWQQISRHEMGLSGALLKQEPETPLKWVQWYEDRRHRLLVEDPNVLRATNDDYGRPYTRVLAVNNWRVRILYHRNTRRIEKLRINDPQTDHTEVIAYHYDGPQGQATSREFIPPAADLVGRIVEYPEYAPDGSLKALLYVRKKENTTEQFLRVEFEYYTEAQWYEHIQAIVREQWGEAEEE